MQKGIISNTVIYTRCGFKTSIKSNNNNSVYQFRVFVGSEMYRSLTPLNMECNSSDESSAFSTLIKEEEGHQDLSLPTHSTSTNGHGQLHLGGSDEVVFRPSAPRGPLARFVAETNGLRSDETSLDMIKISLKDSSSSVDEERQKTRSDNTNEITTTTMISDNVQHVSSGVAAPEQDLKSMGGAAAALLQVNVKMSIILIRPKMDSVSQNYMEKCLFIYGIRCGQKLSKISYKIN